MLENNKIRLRAVEPSDIEILYQWENNTNIWIVGENNTPYSRFDIERYVMSEGDIYTNKQLRLMINTANTNETVGSIDVFDYNPMHRRAGIGIIIYDTKNRHKGFASSALEIVIKYAFSELDIHMLYCNISANNTISLNLFKKAGFEICSHKKNWNRINGNWQDEYTLQLENKKL